jgi:hypothetical protein
MTTDSRIGKLVLVGLCYYDRDGKLVQQLQRHGTIERIDINGIAIQTDTGLFVLPSDPECLQAAPSGEFREHSTGKTIVNPDYITMWNLYKSDDGRDNWTWKRGAKIQFPPRKK